MNYDDIDQIWSLKKTITFWEVDLRSKSSDFVSFNLIVIVYPYQIDSTFFLSSLLTTNIYWFITDCVGGRRGRDSVVVGLLPMQSVFITTDASSNPTQAIQHYVIRSVTYNIM